MIAASFLAATLLVLLYAVGATAANSALGMLSWFKEGKEEIEGSRANARVPVSASGSSEECGGEGLKEAQVRYFSNAKTAGMGYAKFFSNKAWTDQVAIALYFHSLETTLTDETTVLFVDVGANIGQTVRFIGDVFKRQQKIFPAKSEFISVSLEPSPTTFQSLRIELARTRRRDRRSVYAALNVGVGNKPGVLNFYSKGHGDQGATFNPRARQGRPVYAKVPIVTVDQIVRGYRFLLETGKLVEDGGGGADANLRVIVKIDVEGYETTAIRGALQSLREQRVGAIVWEWVPEKMPKGSLREQAEIISEQGYEVFISTTRAMVRIDGSYWNPMYETNPKTINIGAYLSGSPELAAIKRSALLCGSSGGGGAACTCWDGVKSDLPADQFQALAALGLPMGRE